MDLERKRSISNTEEANMAIDQQFYDEDLPLGSWPKNASPNEAENANMNMDRIFNGSDQTNEDIIQQAKRATFSSTNNS